ncbi:MAG: hypothetical protein ACRCXZ_08280 [Patescibacteria group bacterium]
MQITTRIIGPDFRIQASRKAVENYIVQNIPCPNEDSEDLTPLDWFIIKAFYGFEVSDFELDYGSILKLAKQNKNFDQFLQSLPKSQPLVINFDQPFVEIKVGREHKGATKAFSASTKFPRFGFKVEIEFSILPENGTNVLYLSDYFPGYILGGHVGVSSALFLELERIARSNDAKSIKLIAMTESEDYWIAQGFKQRGDYFYKDVAI